MRHPLEKPGEGWGYWRETGIAITIVAAWIGFAVLVEKLTGYDGMRVSGWVIAVIGCGLAVWLWKKNSALAGLASLIFITGFGVAIGLGRF